MDKVHLGTLFVYIYYALNIDFYDFYDLQHTIVLTQNG